MYIRCTESLDSWKNSNSLNVWYRENSMENFVHQMYKKSKFEEMFEFVECTKSWKINGNLCTLNVQNV